MKNKINGWSKILIVIAISLFGFAVAWGTYRNQVNNNTQRVDKIEVKVDKNEDSIARVETKIGFIVDTVKEIKEEVKR